MQMPAEQQSPLVHACHLLDRSAPVVEAMLDRYFPASCWHPMPDGAGHVRLAEPNGASPGLAFRSAVLTLPMLVAALQRGAALRAEEAGARLARQLPVLNLALALIRHPFDRSHQDMVLARMMPDPPAPHRHDDAMAVAIGLRIWILHAWCLELLLAIGLSGSPVPPVLLDLDLCLDALLRPDALWLSAGLAGTADQARCVARAPDDCLPVGNLVFPNRLGARLADACLLGGTLRVAAPGATDDPETAWLRWRGRFVEIPNAYLDSRAKNPVFAAPPMRLGHALC